MLVDPAEAFENLRNANRDDDELQPYDIIEGVGLRDVRIQEI